MSPRGLPLDFSKGKGRYNYGGGSLNDDDDGDGVPLRGVVGTVREKGVKTFGGTTVRVIVE